MKLPLLLHRLAVTLFFSLLTLYTSAIGDSISTPKTKNAHLHFGFLIGANTANFKVNEAPNAISSSLFRNGVSIGLGGDYDLNDHLTLGVQMLVSQNNSAVFVNFNDSSIASFQPVNTSLDSKVFLKYQFLANDKHTPYVFAGLNFRTIIGKELDPEVWMNKSTFPSIDVGCGWKLKNQHFFYSPELQFSYGLKSVGTGAYIDSVQWNTIALLVYFQGN